MVTTAQNRYQDCHKDKKSFIESKCGRMERCKGPKDIKKNDALNDVDGVTLTKLKISKSE